MILPLVIFKDLQGYLDEKSIFMLGQTNREIRDILLELRRYGSCDECQEKSFLCIKARCESSRCINPKRCLQSMKEFPERGLKLCCKICQGYELASLVSKGYMMSRSNLGDDYVPRGHYPYQYHPEHNSYYLRNLYSSYYRHEQRNPTQMERLNSLYLMNSENSSYKVYRQNDY